MWFLTKLWFKISFYKSPISYKYGDKTISGASSQLQKSTISLKIKGPSSKSCGFSSSHVWMWELNHQESWVPRNRCFWNVVLEKTLESPLDCKRSNQSILKEINPEYSLEGLMLKLLYFGHLMWRADSLEKTFESPLHCKRSNQSILKEISSEYSLEGLMLKLKLQYFAYLMWRTCLLEKTLMLVKV